MEAKAIYELLAAKIGEAALGFDDAGPEPVAPSKARLNRFPLVPTPES